MNLRGIQARLARLERRQATTPTRYQTDPIPIERPYEMYLLLQAVDAGEVDQASLEPSLAAELDELRVGLREACRDKVGERIEEMFRQRVQEEGLPCGQVELPAPEASPDEQAPPPEKV
jgi:hypothetical protein